MVINKKLKGNTLPEVLVALTLVSFCSTLAVVIYLNIQQSTMPFIKIKSNELATKFLNEAIQKKDYLDNTYKEEEYTIKKTIIRNQNYADCVDIKIKVYNNDAKKLAEAQTTVYAE